MKNYTKIMIVFEDNTALRISEEEVTVFQMAGGYTYIEYLNDKDQQHRLDGPAMEWADGYKAWFVNGKRHRLDGPAIERSNGSKAWYKNGECTQ